MLFDVDRKEIGSAIMELRVRHNFSQKDLGRHLKLGNTDRSCQNIVSRIESGTQKMTVDEMINIARFFKVSLDMLMSGVVVSENGDNDTALLLNSEVFRLFPGVRSLVEMVNSTAIIKGHDDLKRKMCADIFEKISRVVREEKHFEYENSKVATTDG